MQTAKLNEFFGLVVEGYHPNETTAETANVIRRMLYEHKILLFKHVDISEGDYLRFARTLGKPVEFVDADYRHPDHPEIFVVSNVKKDGKKIGMDRVGYYWHSDSSFMLNPLPVTMLHARTVPMHGGQTAFIDMEHVFATLPELTQEAIAPLVARHEGKWRYIVTEADVGLSIEEILERDERFVPSQAHPLVVTHPETGKRALYLSQGISRRIDGITDDASNSLLSQLWTAVLSNAARYTHRWELGDLIMWDNRSVVHRAYPSENGEGRMMFRIGVTDGPFFGGIA